MIAVDTNLLVQAHRQDAQRHAAAAAALRSLAEGPHPWGIPLHCLIEFGGIVSHQRIFPHPSTIEQAWLQIEAWTASPSVRVLGDHLTTVERAYRLMAGARLAGPHIHDARIAALCLDHGVDELWTIDRDFRLFPGLRTRDPTLE